MPRRRLIHRVVAVGLTASFFATPLAIAVGDKVGAQTSPALATSSSLTVFPPNAQIDGVPGQRILRNVSLENTSAADIKVKTSVKNFKPQLENGEAAPTEEDSSYSMAKWMSVSPRSFSVKPNERISTAVTIAIPVTAEPGSHFGSVIFTPDTSQSQGAIKTVSEVASLILLRIPGPTKEAASVSTFSAKIAGHQKGPVNFTTRLSDAGAVHFTPIGEITVTDMFGRKSTTLVVNPEKRPVLPGAVRRFDNSWKTGMLIGKYKAKLHLTYPSNVDGQPDKTLIASTSFSSYPLLVMAAFGLVVVIVLGLLIWIPVFFVRRRRRKKRDKSDDT